MSVNNTTFRRSPKNKENPYAQVSRDLIRDDSISPDCRHLLIYLLSHNDQWTIKLSQLVNYYNNWWGRDKVYKIVKEAINAGYIKRDEWLDLFL